MTKVIESSLHTRHYSWATDMRLGSSRSLDRISYRPRKQLIASNSRRYDMEASISLTKLQVGLTGEAFVFANGDPLLEYKFF